MLQYNILSRFIVLSCCNVLHAAGIQYAVECSRILHIMGFGSRIHGSTCRTHLDRGLMALHVGNKLQKRPFLFALVM